MLYVSFVANDSIECTQSGGYMELLFYLLAVAKRELATLRYNNENEDENWQQSSW